MDKIEQKALELIEEVKLERKGEVASIYDAKKALCRAIAQHEAFRQEVSDAVTGFDEYGTEAAWERLSRFIIAKPDPLFDVLWALGMADDRAGIELLTKGISAELAKRGLEIREKSDG